MQKTLTIRTFGGFSVTLGDLEISNTASRSKSLWLIFKYIITNRKRAVTTDELIALLWKETLPVNPEKTLFTHISRLRKMLSGGTDAQFISSRQNGYALNSDAQISFDAQMFDDLIDESGKTNDISLKKRLLAEAAAIYEGAYLPDCAGETWAASHSGYLRRQFISAVNELAALYSNESAHDKIIDLCSDAIHKEPYDEALYERLIQSLLIKGELAEAKMQYLHIAGIMKKEFGGQPSDGLLTLYQQIRGDNEQDAIDLGGIKCQLLSEDTRRGALFCTQDTFKQIFNLCRRLDDRVSPSFFLCLVTVSAPEGAELDDEPLRLAMNGMRQCLLQTLRQGDVVSLCSKSQYLLLILAPKIEDAKSALERVKRVHSAGGAAPYRVEYELSGVSDAEQNPHAVI